MDATQMQVFSEIGIGNLLGCNIPAGYA